MLKVARRRCATGHFEAGGLAIPDRGLADGAQADSRFATGVVHCIKGSAIAVAKHGIARAVAAGICSAYRMPAAEFQHPFAVSDPRREQAHPWARGR